jgi:hypothetical protein
MASYKRMESQSLRLINASPMLRPKVNENALEEIISAWTKERDRWETTEALQKVGAAAFLDEQQGSATAHLNHVLLYRRASEVGRRIALGFWRMSGTSCEVQAAAPLRSQHTDMCCAIFWECQKRSRKLREGQVLYWEQSAFSH